MHWVIYCFSTLKNQDETPFHVFFLTDKKIVTNMLDTTCDSVDMEKVIDVQSLFSQTYNVSISKKMQFLKNVY